MGFICLLTIKEELLRDIMNLNIRFQFIIKTHTMQTWKCTRYQTIFK
jgi:hypothetical protein